MSHNCPECKQSILDNQKSLISNPLCTDDCPQDTVCTDTLQSACILYNGGALSCLNVVPGMTLDEVLAKIELSCSDQSTPISSCTVAINEDDTCCGYLEDKLRSETLDITVSDTSCKTISIEEKEWSYSNLTPLNQWLNAKNSLSTIGTLRVFQKNDHVRFTGAIIGTSNTVNGGIAFVLNSSYRPSEQKIFTYFASSLTLTVPLWMVTIVIKTNGQVTINTIQLNSSNPADVEGCFISLDFINYYI